MTLAQRAARYSFLYNMAAPLTFVACSSTTAVLRAPSRCAAFRLAGKRYAESCVGMEPVLQCFAEVLVTLVTLAGMKKLAVVDQRV